MELENNENIGIMAKKEPKLKLKKQQVEEIQHVEEIPSKPEIEELPQEIKKKGRPKKTLTNEEIEFKRQVQEETEKAYRQVLEDRIKKDLKKKLRTEAIEKQEVFKDPELKDPERPKRVLTHKQMENLALGREKAIERNKQKGIISKNINDEIKKIQDSKRNIRKTLIIDKIKEQIDGLESDSEEEQEIVISKKPKSKKYIEKVKEQHTILKELPKEYPVQQKPKIVFY